jgi:hypothetical protein
MAASLQFRYTGGASNSDKDLSLGGVASSVQLAGTPLNNLFDNISAAQAASGSYIDYRAISLHNAGDATATAVKIWVSSDTTSASTEIDLALDSGTQSIAAPGEAAPSSPTLTFSHPNAGGKLAISDIAAGSAQRVWIRRSVTSVAANLASDSGTISVEYA